MYFLERANAYYEAYKRAERVELALDGSPFPKVWRNGNSEKSLADWKKDLSWELITLYPQIKEHCLELQMLVISLESELREQKIKAYELEEKLNGKKD